MVTDDLENLYIKYHRELYLYAFSLCKNYHLAEDLTSDTFFKAMISLDEESSYIKYWLFRVCKNLFLDRLREDKKISQSKVPEDISSRKETPLDSLIDSEEKKELYELVLKLSPSYREMIILYYYCDMSLKEIARTTGLKENNARVLLFRARKKLKILLEEGENEF